jgi:hypothetical protein
VDVNQQLGVEEERERLNVSAPWTAPCGELRAGLQTLSLLLSLTHTLSTTTVEFQVYILID